jgi:glycosyltransferase involved in cell wall biosynthesis
MRIVAVLLVYNSAETIIDCLKSIDGKVDEILCFDGKWEGFSYTSDRSDDGTRDIILAFAVDSKSLVRYIGMPVLHQHEARTRSINQLINGDWIFSIDTDESIILFPENLREILENTKEDVKGYRICVRKPIAVSAYPTFRLVRKTEGLRFSTDHRRVFNNEGELDLAHFPVLTSVVIDHLPKAKDKRMRQYMEEYKKWLHNYEQTHPVM